MDPMIQTETQNHNMTQNNAIERGRARDEAYRQWWRTSRTGYTPETARLWEAYVALCDGGQNIREGLYVYH